MPRQGKKKTAIVKKGMTKDALKESFSSELYYGLAKDEYTTTQRDSYYALAMAIRERLVDRWLQTQQNHHAKKVKRVYYLSLEFLIGRLLGNYILNLGLDEPTRSALKELGFNLEDLCEEESDAGLGNGGLGRLAACFLDSMATLGIPAFGYGIRYDYGIFHQRIINGHQVEQPDEWLKFGNPWEFARPENAMTVKFYGRVTTHHDSEGRLRYVWQDTCNVIALPYDVPVPGFKNDVVNTLRLWSARSSTEFDLDYFNDGDYEKAVYDKMFSENISKVLYPNDANAMGRELRLKQEYFFTAASIEDIVRRFKEDHGDIRKLPEGVAIQLNDTHPALAVAELMRVLIDKELLEWDLAWDIVVRTFGYTNHTVLPEALETWSVELFERLLPRHMQIIYEINARFLRQVANCFPGDTARLERMSLIEEAPQKRIRMAYLAIIGSHSINGVSELHSRLIKNDLFRDFAEYHPDRFNNKTNGITQRRWLQYANPRLSDLITEAIGDRWAKDLGELRKLENVASDSVFQEKWMAIKKRNKADLIAYINPGSEIKVSAESLFDVQIKRIHEYKRQLLFAFYAISQYLKIKNNPKSFRVPRTLLFAGKAAPGYSMAKLIIKFISNIGQVINQDPSVGPRLKVVFLENYRVSLAEKIFPASDLSEQISTAGKEASGTGCMKFMLNGALTIGTWDGANIEMAEEVGEENMFTFGLKTDEIEALRRKGYNPQIYIEKSPLLKEIFHLIRDNFFSPVDPDIFKPIFDNLFFTDPFLVCADFESYLEAQERVSAEYLQPSQWVRKAILNVARSGKFSSDRTIQQYAEDIWQVPYCR